MYSVNVLWFFTIGVSSFGNPRIEAYLQLPAAYRSLSRPSSAPDAKAFTLCSCSLELPSFASIRQDTCALIARSVRFSFVLTWIAWVSLKHGWTQSVSFWVRYSQQKGVSFLLCFASPCWFLSWQNCFYPLIGKTWSLNLFRNRDSSLSSLSVFSYSIYALFDFQWAQTHTWVWLEFAMGIEPRRASASQVSHPMRILFENWWESNPALRSAEQQELRSCT